MFNAALDHIRSQKVYRDHHEFVEADTLQVSNAGLERLGADDVFKLLQKLPAASRNVFVLFSVEGYAHKEIADMLKISEGTSKWHLANAKKLLKTLTKKLTANEWTYGQAK